MGLLAFAPIRSNRLGKWEIPKERIIREEPEKGRNSATRPFLRWAGAVAGPKDLSRRKGFSRP